jgi:hypothetical protein
MNRFLTIASSALIMLPVVAFAQGSVTPAPAKTDAPATTAAAPAAKTQTGAPVATAPVATTAATPAPVSKQMPAAKTDAKAPAAVKKGEAHGTNTLKQHHDGAKTPVAAKG